jgi:hypothetical protein
MTLFDAYLALGGALLALGVAFAAGNPKVNAALLAFPRSPIATVLCFGGAAAWFLFAIGNLGEADLAGFPREWLYGAFGLTALLAFFVLPDLLAVRGLAIAMLLAARELLDIGYMQTPRSLALAATCYAFVVLGVWWGVSPYVFRDWLQWLLAKTTRARAAGGLLAAIAAANLISAFFSTPAPAPL